MPMSSSRTTLSAALLVCSVESTRWPVSDASTPVLAVSASRISPTMITSGSARMKLRMAAANVQPIFGLTCTWRSPGCVISIGSSAVQILRSAVFRCPSRECSVVVLPEPVGPQTRNIPCGREISCFTEASAMRIEADLVDRHRRGGRQQAHHHVLQAVRGRDGGDAQLHGAPGRSG